MTFSRFYRNFKSYGDELLSQLGVGPSLLSEWKTFADQYLKKNRMWGLRWTIPDEEVIEMWELSHPDDRLVGDLSVKEFRALSSVGR